jgi:hypothetical protein
LRNELKHGSGKRGCWERVRPVRGKHMPEK